VEWGGTVWHSREIETSLSSVRKVRREEKRGEAA
jgi:hypothetical protein